ncbi:MAG TPA: hypothetical protein PLP23_19365 [Panacibacter sp.]|nr:hypothetical protein [Panacibacter sp.]
MKYQELLVKTNYDYPYLEIKRKELEQNISSIKGIEGVRIVLVVNSNPHDFKIVIWPTSQISDEEVFEDVSFKTKELLGTNFIISIDWL